MAGSGADNEMEGDLLHDRQRFRELEHLFVAGDRAGQAARPWGWLYLDFVLFAAMNGWALATAVVAALTGLIRKD